MAAAQTLARASIIEGVFDVEPEIIEGVFDMAPTN
jgi:hypothetical protein